jgi:hypothetical protein
MAHHRAIYEHRATGETRFPEHEFIAQFFAAGLANAVSGMLNSRKTNKIDALLGELRRLLKRRPERAIASHLAAAIFTAMLADINAEGRERSALLKDDLLELEQRFPGLEMGTEKKKRSLHRILVNSRQSLDRRNAVLDEPIVDVAPLGHLELDPFLHRIPGDILRKAHTSRPRPPTTLDR